MPAAKPSPRLWRKTAPPEPDALEDRRADDHRQRHRPGEHVRVLPGEAAPARGGQGGAVPRDARGQRGGLGEPEGEPVGGRCASPRSRTWGRRSAITIAAAPTSSPTAVASGPPRSPLDRLLERDAAAAPAGGRRARAPRPCGGRRSAAPRRSPAAGRPAARRPRRRAARPRSSSAARGPGRPRPSPASHGNQGEVGGAGDRKQLGRPLNGAEDDRPRPPHHEAGAPRRPPRRLSDLRPRRPPR